MKYFLLILLISSGFSFAQTTFIVEKRGKLAPNVVIYLHKKQVAKTDSQGKATTTAKIAEGDTIKFYDGWNYALHIATENYEKPLTFHIQLQTVESTGQSQEKSKISNTQLPKENLPSKEITGFQDPLPVPPDRELSDAVVYSNTDVDEPAEFPGGKDALTLFFKKNMKYPEAAKQKKIQGNCYLQFVVGSDGKVSEIKVVRGVTNCLECDMEAVRTAKMMPKWKPAVMHGKAVKTIFSLPVKFSH